MPLNRWNRALAVWMPLGQSAPLVGTTATVRSHS